MSVIVSPEMLASSVLHRGRACELCGGQDHKRRTRCRSCGALLCPDCYGASPHAPYLRPVR